MPSGRTHDRITLWSLPWVVGLTFLLTRDRKLTLILAGAFLFSGMMFGPDLDIYSVQFKRWGKLRWIWLPYQKMLRHRSRLSHGLIVGTTLRVVYLFILLAVAATIGVAVAQLIWGIPWNWQKFTEYSIQSVSSHYLEEASALFLGLELGAMSHSLSDWMGSAYKRFGKKNTKRVTRKKQPKRPSSIRRK